ncbi:translocator protein isoform X2 [Strix aluco]|uniref:translocator protein isoform X2 n=1 Tax=Strix aluco TaxID=111821 RepID=UPI003DA23FBC
MAGTQDRPAGGREGGEDGRKDGRTDGRKESAWARPGAVPARRPRLLPGAVPPLHGRGVAAGGGGAERRFTVSMEAVPGWASAVGFTLLPHAGGFLGSRITRREVPVWYESLQKPSWRPPNWAFAPIWGTLYTSMGRNTYEPPAVAHCAESS